MDKRSILNIVGFLLFVFGMLSLVLALVGVKLSFLVWIDHFGGGIGLLIRLLMIVLGLVMAYAARTAE